jgi:tyrosyl-tRNA synthetase
MKFTTFPENINPFQKKGIVKFGIDPTGSEMHLGHLLPLRIVKKFKEEGFPVCVILGTFTAQIGDATGRDVTRPILSEKETLANGKKLLKQVKRILGNDIIVRENSDWHNNCQLPEFMRILSNFSVQKLLSRDNFAKRFETNTPIAMHELMGPILQGIDSVVVGATIEIGGSDQLFNFVVSREVQEIMEKEPEICVMSPVINGLDGRKMSKSFGNCIFLNDTPEDIFGKAMSISDETMREWLPLFFDEIDVTKHPMQQKKELAFQITTEIWSKEAAEKGKAHFESVIQNSQLPENMPEFPVGNFIEIVSKIVDGSKSDARRLFQSGAVKVNNEKVSETFDLKSGDIVKVGKRNFGKII